LAPTQGKFELDVFLANLAADRRRVSDELITTQDSTRRDQWITTLRGIGQETEQHLDFCWNPGVGKKITSFLEVIEDTGWPRVRVTHFADDTSLELIHRIQQLTWLDWTAG